MEMKSYEAAMRDTADEVRGLAKHLGETVLGGIQDGTKQLTVDWDGQGGGMFAQVNAKFAHHMTNIATKLTELGTLLDTVADEHKFADNKVAGMMEIPQFNLAGDNVSGNMITGHQPSGASADRLSILNPARS